MVTRIFQLTFGTPYPYKRESKFINTDQFEGNSESWTFCLLVGNCEGFWGVSGVWIVCTGFQGMIFYISRILESFRINFNWKKCLNLKILWHYLSPPNRPEVRKCLDFESVSKIMHRIYHSQNLITKKYTTVNF